LIDGVGTALNQAVHFAGKHGKPSASFTSTGGFHRGAQDQDVGPKGCRVGKKSLSVIGL
jgi:hypothetical protein